MAPYTNKGYAVKELCSYLQINMDDVYTIGGSVAKLNL